MQYYQNKVSGFKMKILVYFIYFLILIFMVESRRQKFVKSRRVRPRGNRHHIFKDVNPSKTKNDIKTTKVTKVVTVNGNGHKTVKNINDDQNEFYDYHPNNDPNPGQYPSPHPHPHPHPNPNPYPYPYQEPGSHPPKPGPKPIPGPYPVPNPGPNLGPYPGPYPGPKPGPNPGSNHVFNSNFPPNPPSDPHHPAFDISYPPWHVPKYKEYTTECCTTINVSTSDQSQHISRGIVIQILEVILD